MGVSVGITEMGLLGDLWEEQKKGGITDGRYRLVWELERSCVQKGAKFTHGYILKPAYKKCLLLFKHTIRPKRLQNL